MPLWAGWRPRHLLPPSLLLLCLAGAAHADVLKIGVLIESSGGWEAGQDVNTGAELAQEYFVTAGTELGDWATTNGHSIEFVGVNNDTACQAHTALGLAAAEHQAGVEGVLGPGCSRA